MEATLQDWHKDETDCQSTGCSKMSEMLTRSHPNSRSRTVGQISDREVTRRSGCGAGGLIDTWRGAF